MKYCVLVKISKDTLSFWYQLDGGVHTPLSINEGNCIPLCFYVNNNDFQVGEFAKERFLINDTNSYNNYFELIKNPTNHFILHGDSKPIKQLLYYGIENYLSYFIKSILYKNESIESYRKNFCLRFWYDHDIEDQEKKLIENLFYEAGYENIEEINFNHILNNEYNSINISTKSRLWLFAKSNDLYINLYLGKKYDLINRFKLPELGSDPRAKILANLILEDIKEMNQGRFFIDDNIEIPHILNHCYDILKNLTPIINNEISLSNGAKTNYRIKLHQLEERLTYNRGIEDKIIPKIEEFIKTNDLNFHDIDVILYGDTLDTDYFKNKLTKKIPNVYGVSSNFEPKILKSIFSEIVSNGYISTNVVKSTLLDNIETPNVVNISNNISTPPVISIPTNKKPEINTPPVVKIPANKKPEINTPPVVNIPEGKKPEINTPPVVNIPASKKPEINTPPVVNIPANKKPEINTPPVVNIPTGKKPSSPPPPPPPPVPPKK